MQLNDKDKSRFWARVNKASPDECWEWTGTKVNGGYGVVTCQKRTTLATHVSLMIDGRQRPAPPSHFALHGDNCTPSCVNPRHLRWGTQIENMADKFRLGRQNCPQGADHHAAHPDDAHSRFRKLQAVYLPGRQQDVADLLGISRAMVGDVRKGRRWKHITLLTEDQVDWILQELADKDARSPATRRDIPGVAFTEDKRTA